MDYIWLVFLGGIALGLVVFFAQQTRHAAWHRRRRDTLYYDSDAGLYRWTEPSGVRRSAANHPDEPGGLWYDAVHRIGEH